MRDDVRASRGSQQVNNETLEPHPTMMIVDLHERWCIVLYPSDERVSGASGTKETSRY